MKLLPILGATAVLLAGCVKPPDLAVHQFQVPAPAAWQAGDTDDAPPAAEWWAYFENPQLDEVIRKALDCSLTVAGAAARLEAAMHEQVAADKATRPTVDLTVNRLRQRQNFIGLPFPGLAGRVLSNTFSNSGLSLNISWEADLWKRLGAAKVAAAASVTARRADRHAARLSISGQVAKAWLAAAEAQAQIEQGQALVDHLETTAARTRERYRAGYLSPLEVRAAELAVRQARAALPPRRQARDALVRQVEALACEYPAGARAVGASLPELPERVPAGLPAELLHRRPDLVAAERALLAADARIVQARAALKPSFAFTSAIGTSSNRIIDVVNPGLQVWNYALLFAQPLLNRQRLRANVRASEARSREAAAAYEGLIWNAYREVETALAAEETLRGQEETLLAAHEVAEEAVALAEGRYRAALSDVFGVLSRRGAVLESRSALLALRRARLENRVDLHLALGGGFASDADPGAAPPAVQQ